RARVADIEAQGVGCADVFDGVVETLASIASGEGHGRGCRPVRANYNLVLFHWLDVGIHTGVLGIDDVLAEVYVLNEPAHGNAGSWTRGGATMQTGRTGRDFGVVRIVEGIGAIMPVLAAE